MYAGGETSRRIDMLHAAIYGLGTQAGYTIVSLVTVENGRSGEKGKVAKISKTFFSKNNGCEKSVSIHQKHNLPICLIFIHAPMRYYNLVKTKYFPNLDLQSPFFNLPYQLL